MRVCIIQTISRGDGNKVCTAATETSILALGPLDPGPIWALGPFGPRAIFSLFGPGPVWAQGHFYPIWARARLGPGPIWAQGQLGSEGCFFRGPDFGEGFPLNVAHICPARGPICSKSLPKLTLLEGLTCRFFQMLFLLRAFPQTENMNFRPREAEGRA